MSLRGKCAVWLVMWLLGWGTLLGLASVMFLSFVSTAFTGFVLVGLTNSVGEFYPELVLITTGLFCFVVTRFWVPVNISSGGRIG